MEIIEVAVPLENTNKRNHANVLTRKFVIKDAVNISVENGGLPIYACDKVSKTVGAKEFYTGSYDKFWQLYQKLPVGQRCFYETLLPEQPCHLYIDMEGEKVKEMNIPYESLSIKLLHELLNFMATFLCITENTNSFRIVELDSCKLIFIIMSIF